MSQNCAAGCERRQWRRLRSAPSSLCSALGQQSTPAESPELQTASQPAGEPHRHIRKDLSRRLACTSRTRGRGEDRWQEQRRRAACHHIDAATCLRYMVSRPKSMQPRHRHGEQRQQASCSSCPAAAAVGGSGCRRRRGSCPLTRQQQRQQACERHRPPSHAGCRAGLRAAHTGG